MMMTKEIVLKLLLVYFSLQLDLVFVIAEYLNGFQELAELKMQHHWYY